MTETAISPLRQRMIDDMTVRHFVEKTRTDYIRQVRRFAAFLGRSPETASPEDVRRFQLHLTESGVTPPSMQRGGRGPALLLHRHARSGRSGPASHPGPRAAQSAPRSEPEEVAQLLEAAPGPKYKAALSAAYGAGLRVSEVVSLKVCDIDSQRMLIRIEQGKGRKDRYAMLSPQLLELLRDWWRDRRGPPVWLFPGQNPVNPLTTRQLNRAFHAAAQQAGITKRVTPHTLRHSFATHLLEQNIDIRVIQVLLGHAKLETTALYTRVATSTIRAVMSPLDRLTC